MTVRTSRTGAETGARRKANLCANALPGSDPGDGRSLHQPRGLMEKVAWSPVSSLKPFPNNPRRHPESQIAGLMKNIGRVWTNPILVDETGTILAGHGRLEAAKRLGMSEVPTLC